jgi:hypothetical protein
VTDTEISLYIGASDATFHVMWVILFNAVDDFGVREFNMHLRMNSPVASGLGSHHPNNGSNGGGDLGSSATVAAAALGVFSPAVVAGSNGYQVQLTVVAEIMRKVLDEGLHGALRIAGLAGVLTKNGYLVRSLSLPKAIIA